MMISIFQPPLSIVAAQFSFYTNFITDKILRKLLQSKKEDSGRVIVKVSCLGELETTVGAMRASMAPETGEGLVRISAALRIILWIIFHQCRIEWNERSVYI